MYRQLPSIFSFVNFGLGPGRHPTDPRRAGHIITLVLLVSWQCCAYGQAESGQAESGQAESGQAESGQNEGRQTQDDRVKANQTKEIALTRYTAAVLAIDPELSELDHRLDVTKRQYEFQTSTFSATLSGQTYASHNQSATSATLVTQDKPPLTDDRSIDTSTTLGAKRSNSTEAGIKFRQDADLKLGLKPYLAAAFNFTKQAQPAGPFELPESDKVRSGTGVTLGLQFDLSRNYLGRRDHLEDTLAHLELQLARHRYDALQSSVCLTAAKNFVEGFFAGLKAIRYRTRAKIAEEILQQIGDEYRDRMATEARYIDAKIDKLNFESELEHINFTAARALANISSLLPGDPSPLRLADPQPLVDAAFHENLNRIAPSIDSGEISAKPESNVQEKILPVSANRLQTPPLREQIAKSELDLAINAVALAKRNSAPDVVPYLEYERRSDQLALSTSQAMTTHQVRAGLQIELPIGRNNDSQTLALKLMEKAHVTERQKRQRLATRRQLNDLLTQISQITRRSALLDKVIATARRALEVATKDLKFQRIEYETYRAIRDRLQSLRGEKEALQQELIQLQLETLQVSVALPRFCKGS